jgi:hypothetical protein
MTDNIECTHILVQAHERSHLLQTNVNDGEDECILNVKELILEDEFSYAPT